MPHYVSLRVMLLFKFSPSSVLELIVTVGAPRPPVYWARTFSSSKLASSRTVRQLELWQAPELPSAAGASAKSTFLYPSSSANSFLPSSVAATGSDSHKGHHPCQTLSKGDATCLMSSFVAGPICILAQTLLSAIASVTLTSL